MNKEKHSKEVVEIANTIVNECGNAPCKECMWCDAATWAHAKALYNADYRKQEWISVEDRLPEESCEVLTVDRTGAMYLAPYSDRYKAFNATDEDGGDRWKLTVTHWMPLPEAPKMKGGAE